MSTDEQNAANDHSDNLFSDGAFPPAPKCQAIPGALLLIEHPTPMTTDDLVAILGQMNIINPEHWTHRCGPSPISKELAFTAFLAVGQDPILSVPLALSRVGYTLDVLKASQRLCNEAKITVKGYRSESTWLRHLWDKQPTENIKRIVDIYRKSAHTWLERALQERALAKRPHPHPAKTSPRAEWGNILSFGDWREPAILRISLLLNLVDETRKAFVKNAPPALYRQRQEVWDEIRPARAMPLELPNLEDLLTLLILKLASAHSTDKKEPRRKKPQPTVSKKRGRHRQKDPAWSEKALRMRASKTPVKDIAVDCGVSPPVIERFFNKMDKRNGRAKTARRTGKPSA